MIEISNQWIVLECISAEVQAAAGQYDTSLLLYGRALQLQPNDISILNAAKRIAQISNYEIHCKNSSGCSYSFSICIE